MEMHENEHGINVIVNGNGTDNPVFQEEEEEHVTVSFIL